MMVLKTFCPHNTNLTVVGLWCIHTGRNWNLNRDQGTRKMGYMISYLAYFHLNRDLNREWE